MMEDLKGCSKEAKKRLMAAHPNKPESSFRVVKDPQQRSAAPKRKPAARREASVQEKRDYAKQFQEAKAAECKSWLEENDVLDVVDMRKQHVPNFITGR